MDELTERTQDAIAL